VTLGECCISNGLGAEVLCGTDERVDSALFAENPGRVIVSCPSEFDSAELQRIAAEKGCPCAFQGWVKGNRLRIAFGKDDIPVDVAVDACRDAWENAIPEVMD